MARISYGQEVETTPRRYIGIYDNLADAQPSILFPIEEIYTPILEEGFKPVTKVPPR